MTLTFESLRVPVSALAAAATPHPRLTYLDAPRELHNVEYITCFVNSELFPVIPFMRINPIEEWILDKPIIEKRRRGELAYKSNAIPSLLLLLAPPSYTAHPSIRSFIRSFVHLSLSVLSVECQLNEPCTLTPRTHHTS